MERHLWHTLGMKLVHGDLYYVYVYLSMSQSVYKTSYW